MPDAAAKESKMRAYDRPERNPPYATAEPPRLSWPSVLAINFIPGLATVALLGLASPAARALGLPPVAAYTAAIGLVTLGEAAFLSRQAVKLSGSRDPRRANALPLRLPFRLAILPVVGLILATAALSALLEPLAAAIDTRLDPFLPDWLDIDTDSGTVAAYGRAATIAALAFNFLIDVLASPYVEELYWKGYLMRRLPVGTAFQPILLALLFASQHFWQPGEFLLVALLQVAIGVHARRTGSLTVAIWSHWIANGLVTLLSMARTIA